MRHGIVLAAAGAVALLAGCSGDEPIAPAPPSPSATTTEATADPFASPVIDGSYAVEGDRSVAIECWGSGTPSVILETGHPSPGGIQQFGGTDFARRLAEASTVCAYDRAGTGHSDPAPERPRSADDVVDDLHQLLTKADVHGPFVLIGSSFGGMIVTHFATRYSNDTAGVVLLDVPAPTDDLTLKEVPELAWDAEENPEHLDVIPEFETRFAGHPAMFQAPLLVITSSAGQSSLDDQRVWLRQAPDSEQVELAGGHDIWLDNPDEVEAEVARFIDDL